MTILFIILSWIFIISVQFKTDINHHTKLSVTKNEINPTSSFSNFFFTHFGLRCIATLKLFSAFTTKALCVIRVRNQVHTSNEKVLNTDLHVKNSTTAAESLNYGIGLLTKHNLINQQYQLLKSWLLVGCGNGRKV